MLDISSMIDVSFLLICYFLVTTSLKPQEVDLGLRLPSDSTPVQDVEQRPLTLKLNSDGSVIAEPNTNAQPLGNAGADFTFPELKSRLETYKTMATQLRADPFVVIMADDEANNQDMMNVFNAIYEVGITSVTLSGFRDG
ncbi:MAG: ExbD/TolR family protein [Verrucomicrobiales bacterium]